LSDNCDVNIVRIKRIFQIFQQLFS
jgi:hypothetical protein